MKSGSARGRIISLGLIFSLLLAWLFLKLSKKRNPPNAMSIIKTEGIALYNDLQKIGFRPNMAKMITAQSAHETGNFTSPLFIEQNNLFGMRHPRVRKTFSTGEKNYHAVFKSVSDSIADYKIYFSVFNYLPEYSSVSTFVEALSSRGYFTAPKETYKKGVTYFYEIYFPDANK